jgi:uncharacterized protein
VHEFFGAFRKPEGFLPLRNNDVLMSFEDAVRSSAAGVLLELDVSPGARRTEVPSGYNEWRKRIEVKLKAPPEKGKANEELMEALSELLHVPSASVEISAGATNSKKSILIRGVTRDEVLKIFGGLI